MVGKQLASTIRFGLNDISLLAAGDRHLEVVNDCKPLGAPASVMEVCLEGRWPVNVCEQGSIAPGTTEGLLP